MADGSEDSYLYMRSRGKITNLLGKDTVSSNSPPSPVPKASAVCADAQRLSTPNVCPESLNTVAGHSSSSNVTQPMGAPTAKRSNYDDCMAFDLYEQDPDTEFDCQDYSLRRQSSDFRFNFEEMIVLPIRLKKPSTFTNFDTPPYTDVDEFDYADQHVYYSNLITTVNSNSAIHEYGTRKGPLWDCAWEMLVPKGLHPSYLTESEFVKLVLSQGNDTAQWMDVNIPILHRRALSKARVAREKLSNAGISPFEMTQEYLEAFEWMDKIEQDNFIKTMQKLQLQVAMQKTGLSMRIEDIDNTTPVDAENLIGKSHTKLVDGYCIPRDNSSDSDDSFVAKDTLSLQEFEDLFWKDAYLRGPSPAGSKSIQQTHQSPTAPDIGDETISVDCIKAIICPDGVGTGDSKHIENHEAHTNSNDIQIHQDTKNARIIGTGNLRQSQFPPLEASSPYISSFTLPPKSPESHVNFSLQDPPPLVPTRSLTRMRTADSGYQSDGAESMNSTVKGSGGRSLKLKGSVGRSQSQKSRKTEGSGVSGSSGKMGSIGQKIADSPNSLKKKLSSVFGTIGRSGKRRT